MWKTIEVDSGSKSEASVNGRTVSAYVINLDKRADRYLIFNASFESFPIEIKRISAIDGREFVQDLEKQNSGTILTTKEKERALIDPGNLGICLSYQKVFNLFLESNAEYAIIFEDDARPVKDISLMDVQNFLDIMVELEIDVLQLGFITRIYREFYLKKFSFSNRGIRINLMKPRQGIKTKNQNVVLNETLPGTHAHIVNRKAAEMLISINTPVVFPQDDLLANLSRLARYGAFPNMLRLARLRDSAFEQSSRRKGQIIDSNVEM